MALASKTRSSPVIDLSSLKHLHEHPELKPRFSRRGEILEQLRVVEADIRAKKRTLFGAQDDTSFAATVARRETEDALAALERQGVTLGSELRDVNGELETAKEQVQSALTPLLAAEGVPLTEELLNAVQQLADIAGRYVAFSERTRRLRGSPLASVPWAIACLPGCVVSIERTLDHLQRLVSTAAGR